MGRDKALVEVDGMPMSVRVAGVLRAAGASPVLAIGGDEAALGALGLSWCADRYPGEGPLGGVLSAFEALPDSELIAVLATDLPTVSSEVVVALVDAVDGHDLAAAATDRLEPLCAVWRRAACLAVLGAAFEQGERAVHRALAGLDLALVRVEPSMLRNVNAPGDLGR